MIPKFPNIIKMTKPQIWQKFFNEGPIKFDKQTTPRENVRLEAIALNCLPPQYQDFLSPKNGNKFEKKNLASLKLLFGGLEAFRFVNVIM